MGYPSKSGYVHEGDHVVATINNRAISSQYISVVDRMHWVKDLRTGEYFRVHEHQIEKVLAAPPKSAATTDQVASKPSLDAEASGDKGS